MTKDKKQIAFTGTQEYHDWVRDQAQKHNIKVQKFLERAVSAYVEQDGAAPVGPKWIDPAITPQNQREAELVAGVLACARNGPARKVLLPAIEALLAAWLGSPKKKNGTEES